MRWIASLWLAIAACSMGKDPAKKPPPPPPPAMGTVTGHVIFAMHGPGRAHSAAESFTHTSGIECTVRAGSATTRTGPDGAYTLRLAVGHHEVSFEDCVKGCCSARDKTLATDVTAGGSTLDFTCECYAK